MNNTYEYNILVISVHNQSITRIIELKMHERKKIEVSQRMMFSKKEVGLPADESLRGGKRSNQLRQARGERRDRGVVVAGTHQLRAKLSEKLASAERAPLEQLPQQRHLQLPLVIRELRPPLRLRRRVRHPRALRTGSLARQSARTRRRASSGTD